MKTKNQLVISMVPIHSRHPWASCKFWVCLYRRHFI